MWKAYEDQFAIELLSPGGESLGVLSSNPGAQRLKTAEQKSLCTTGSHHLTVHLRKFIWNFCLQGNIWMRGFGRYASPENW